MTKLLAVLVCAAGCSSRSAPEPTQDHTPVARDPAPDPVVHAAIAEATKSDDQLHWYAGDLHMHVAPPDDPGDVTLSVQQIAKEAAANKMDFVVLTPHVGPWRWTNGPAARAEFQRAWKKLAQDSEALTATTGVALIPGAEWTTRDGHFTVTGADIAKLAGDDFLGAAHAAGAFISVNHPFAVPTHIPGAPISEWDLSYKHWTNGAPGFTQMDGAEVWNVPLGLANLISRPGGKTGEEHAWTALHDTVVKEHRRMVAVGGTDNHKTNVAATTWVLAPARTPAAILTAIRAGATCVGGPDAGTLHIHGDGDPAGTWHRIGESAPAPHDVALRWDGRARLFIDDVDRGEHDGGFTHETGGKLHTYRIATGASRCGFAYANL